MFKKVINIPSGSRLSNIKQCKIDVLRARTDNPLTGIARVIDKS